MMTTEEKIEHLNWMMSTTRESKNPVFVLEMTKSIIGFIQRNAKELLTYVDQRILSFGFSQEV